MNAPAQPIERARIGPFDVNFRLGELRKHGIRLKIHEQPLKILEMLVARPGELVSREEIRQTLWPSGTFVGFDNSLNNAVNRLRAVLGDSAEVPRFIETVPRRGYVLIGPVERFESPAMLPALAIAAEQPVGRGEFTGLRSLDRRRWLWAGALALVAAIAGSTALALLHLRDPAGRKEAAHLPASTVRIVALPFVNLTGDPHLEYFCDGITEEMIAVLGALSPGQLDVIARTSAMHYKNTVETIPQIGHELKVDYVLESSVRQSGRGLRVTAQLIRASDASHVWAGEFDLNSDDAMDSEEEAAAEIADSIKVTLSPAIDARSPSVHTADPEAYRDYLLGRYYWNKRSREGLQSARKYFQRAIDRDPNYARAYLGLADDYLVLGAGMMPADEAYPKAKATAMKALELDNQLAEAYASLAYEEFIDEWDWDGAEANYRRSLALNPNYATAHEWYAIFLAAMRRYNEAVKEINRALELDPLSLPVTYNASSIYLQLGRSVEAFELAKKSLEIDPGSTPAHYTLAAVYEKTGRYRNAISEFQEASRDDAEARYDTLLVAHTYAMEGDRAKAVAILRHWLPVVNTPVGDSYGVAIVYAALGERDQAFPWLRKAVERRSCSPSEINTDWRLDPLRTDPQFAEIRAQFRLPN